MTRKPPSFEPRRHRELREELLARARAWLDGWRPRGPRADFGVAVLEIAARLAAEVTQRLDRVPEKSRRGFFQWLGIRGRAGLAARVPLAFKMGAGAEPLDADAGVRLQALVDPDPITFETDSALRLVTANLAQVVGADPESDVFTLPPRALFRNGPPPAEPDDWLLKAPAGANAPQLQLEPQIGLDPGVVLETETGGHQHRVEAAKDGIITIAPPLDITLPGDAALRRVESFAPFEGEPRARNRQEHALYLGSEAGLDIATAAVIEIDGGGLPNVKWEYWGKSQKSAEGEAAATWRALTPIAAEGRLLLSKPQGAVEPTTIGGRSSRWLRLKREGPVGESVRVPSVSLRVNCPGPEGAKIPDPLKAALGAVADQSVKFEGIANTAPLVVDQPFYPLGPDPRIFDAFYLGSKEAFSKPGAMVTLDIHVDDIFETPLAGAALSANGDGIAFAVGRDGKLHRMEWEPLGKLAFATPSPPSDTPTLSLTKGPRPAVLVVNGKVYVTVAAGRDVWMWKRTSKSDPGGWTPLGRPTLASTEAPIVAAGDTVLVRSADGLTPAVYAVFDAKVFRRNLDTNDWVAIDEMKLDVARLAPIIRVDDEDQQELFEEDGLVCLTTNGRLFRRRGSEWKEAKGRGGLDPTVYPLALKVQQRVIGFASRRARDAVVSFDLDALGEGKSTAQALVGQALTFALRRGQLIAIFLADVNGVARLTTWNPSGSTSEVRRVDAGLKFALGPLRVWRRLLVPGDRGDVFAFKPGPAETFAVDLAVGAVLVKDPGDEPWWLLDFTRTSEPRRVAEVTKKLALDDGRWALALPPGIDTSADPLPADVYKPLTDRGLPGIRLSAKRIQLSGDEPDDENSKLVFFLSRNGEAYIREVQRVKDGVATMKATLPWQDQDHLRYRSIAKLGQYDVLLRPILTAPSIEPSRLRGATLQFPQDAFDPSVQVVETSEKHGAWHVLARAWKRADSSAMVGLVDGLFGPLERFAPLTTGNPDLSWEYWNGSGWWRIDRVDDRTGNLVQSATITFPVPRDLVATDVAGHSNHWIRARLVGGDYGQEDVSLEDDTTGKKHKVVRDRSGIHAPYIVTLKISYSVCTPIVPDVVLAQDNGWYRDQTEANRTPGAVVECFVPLREALARVTAEETSACSAKPDASAAPECVPCGNTVWPEDAPEGTVDAADDGGRALYLCFDAELAGAPINLLFLVEDRDFQEAFPLRVDALFDDRFVPILASDGTRGLSESGILSITLDVSPRRRQLFGATGYWLRLRPNVAFDSSKWQPKIAGAYLNAVWATAAETQTLEPLGSSDGRPDLTVLLTRKPVLADGPPALRASEGRTGGDALELRVRERLTDEEIDDLDDDDASTVVDLADRPGKWVRWTQVADLADAAADDRVYTLEEASGRITFGDGLHGRIPPIGRDVILAVRYRQGGGAAANRIKAWNDMNLVTPLLGVERVLVPVAAAGGADPQDAATTVRFASSNVAMQERALVLRDFESLALQFAPDVAQARALATSGGVRIVVVARGDNPTPSHELVRALRAHLLASASPTLAWGDGLLVVPPRLVKSHVELLLVVDAIERTGPVGRVVTDRIRGLLSPASGGLDGTGWLLGAIPGEEDVAAALVDVVDLARIETVILSRVDADGGRHPLDRALRADELLHLPPDGVQVRFVSGSPGVAA